MNLTRVEAIVRERLGLDLDSLGASTFPLAVQTRMRATATTSPDAYAGVLVTDRGELGALAGELVVPETWFFRGGRAFFDHLVLLIAAQSVKRTTVSPVRILSVPCSTGEEPYSLAIALHAEGVPSAGWRIDAVDLATRHLDRAQEGSYPEFSFREPGPDIRTTHFHRSADRWTVTPEVRDRVHFRHGNITDPAVLQGEPVYDVILCRNLFIYLTDEGRRHAMRNLDRLLAADGYLCLTAGEADRLPAGRFIPEALAAFGIYRRAIGVSDQTALARPLPARPAQPSRPRAPKLPARLATDTPPPVAPLARPPVAPATHPAAAEAAADLADARAKANAGRLAEARAACEQVLRQHADHADAHALLGVICVAEGRETEAAVAFRRALYLDPDHPEALGHMIVISERRGDTTQAAAFRRRLDRSPRKDGT